MQFTSVDIWDGIWNTGWAERVLTPDFGHKFTQEIIFYFLFFFFFFLDVDEAFRFP
jgi:hypothetical protein